MNYKMLFIVSVVHAPLLEARHYESMFSEWGRYLDQIHDGFDAFYVPMHTSMEAQVSSPAFSLEKTANSVIVTVDTGKKVTADDITITHKKNRVSVEVAGLEHTLSLKLEASRYALGIALCSQKQQEKKGEHEFSAFQGSSCMQQVMSVSVDLAGITAEYSGTKLVLSLPLIKEEEHGKKIDVVMKTEESMPQKAVKVAAKKVSKTHIDEK